MVACKHGSSWAGNRQVRATCFTARRLQTERCGHRPPGHALSPRGRAQYPAANSNPAPQRGRPDARTQVPCSPCLSQWASRVTLRPSGSGGHPLRPSLTRPHPLSASAPLRSHLQPGSASPLPREAAVPPCDQGLPRLTAGAPAATSSRAAAPPPLPPDGRAAGCGKMFYLSRTGPPLPELSGQGGKLPKASELGAAGFPVPRAGRGRSLTAGAGGEWSSESAGPQLRTTTPRGPCDSHLPRAAEHRPGLAEIRRAGAPGSDPASASGLPAGAARLPAAPRRPEGRRRLQPSQPGGLVGEGCCGCGVFIERDPRALRLGLCGWRSLCAWLGRAWPAAARGWLAENGRAGTPPPVCRHGALFPPLFNVRTIDVG